MIPLFRPSFCEKELEALRETIETGWVGLGPKTKEFEDRFARFVDAPHAIGVDSHGDIYIGEVAMSRLKIDRGPRSLQKFARIS